MLGRSPVFNSFGGNPRELRGNWEAPCKEAGLDLKWREE